MKQKFSKINLIFFARTYYYFLIVIPKDIRINQKNRFEFYKSVFL